MLRLVLIAFLLEAANGKLVPMRMPPAGGKIVGGEDAEIEDVPYQAGLLYGRKFICGGSILSETVVLSAAHCALEEISGYRIFVGTNMIYKPEVNQSQIVDVKSVVIHPDYNIFNSEFDAALFFLSSPLKLGPTASPVALPYQSQDIPNDTPAIASGWGSLQEGGPISDVLQKVTVPIVDQDVCQAAYAKKNLMVTMAMICAGLIDEGGKDACQGDSGGPLVVDGTLVGITSWGYGCARPGYPGISTRVPTISNWIKNQLLK